VPEVLSASALGAAQHAYFERMAEAIATVPGGVTRILDVGSGTGANARALIERGYEVACVSPSAQMNEMARAKLPAGTQVTDATFEGSKATRGTISACSRRVSTISTCPGGCSRRRAMRKKGS
jgi:SAM-dependent methyltransferase